MEKLIKNNLGQWELKNEEDLIKVYDSSKVRAYQDHMRKKLRESEKKLFEDHPTKGEALSRLEVSSPEHGYSGITRTSPYTGEQRTTDFVDRSETMLRRKPGKDHSVGDRHISREEHDKLRNAILEWGSKPENVEKINQHNKLQNRVNELISPLNRSHASVLQLFSTPTNIDPKTLAEQHLSSDSPKIKDETDKAF